MPAAYEIFMVKAVAAYLSIKLKRPIIQGQTTHDEAMNVWKEVDASQALHACLLPCLLHPPHTLHMLYADLACL
jgi:hypothetical protein